MHRNAAVLTFVRTDCRVKVFSLDHLVPSDVRMVVTEADPSQRIVRQINAEPAALAYARLLGKDPSQLTTFTFAAHPVVVRLGGQHHVRSIQRILPNGDLVFFSAIDEGLVLRLADPMDMEAASGARAVAPVGGRRAGGDPRLRLHPAPDRGRGKTDVRRAQPRPAAPHASSAFPPMANSSGRLHVNQTMTGRRDLSARTLVARMTHSLVNPADPPEVQTAKLIQIADVLMRRVEQGSDDQGAAYTQFQRAVLLEDQVRARTSDLERALDLLNGSNARLGAGDRRGAGGAAEPGIRDRGGAGRLCAV